MHLNASCWQFLFFCEFGSLKMGKKDLVCRKMLKNDSKLALVAISISP
jgi:hypothetical protein